VVLIGRLDEPVIKPIGRNLYELRKNYIINLEFSQFVVKKGFRTDGASVPRFLWFFVGHPFEGDIIGPAILHDSLYQSKILPRTDADSIFNQAMKQKKVKRLKRFIYFLGVRLFGGFAWKHSKHRKKVSWREL